MLSREPVSRLSMQTTSQPLPSRKSQRWEPMKPAAAVTRAGNGASSGRQDGLASDGVVLEAEPAHALRLVEVASVEDDGAAQEAAEALEVEVLELVPLRDEHGGVRPLGRLVRRAREGDAGGQEGPGIVHGHGVIGPDARARLVEEMDDLDALGLAHVVGVGLEGQTQHGHYLVVERAKG